MKKAGEILGVDSLIMSDKCTKASIEMIKNVTEDKEWRNPLLDNIKDNFTKEELILIAFEWVTEKTVTVLDKQSITNK